MLNKQNPPSENIYPIGNQAIRLKEYKMNNTFTRIFATVVLSVLLIGVFAIAAPAFGAGLQTPARSPGPTNKIYVDVTINTADGTYSIGGFTSEQLEALGLPGLDTAIVSILDNFQSADLEATDNETTIKAVMSILDNFHSAGLEVTGNEMAIKLDNKLLASLDLDAEGVESLFKLISQLANEQGGLNLTDPSKDRIEDWLALADVTLKIRNSKAVSYPLVVNLATPFEVDVAPDGRVYVEGIDTGTEIVSGTLEIINKAGIENAVICLNKDTFSTKVNGNDLPEITVYPKGLDVLDKAFKLGLDPQRFIDSNLRLGADIGLNGSQHGESTYCGE